MTQHKQNQAKNEPDELGTDKDTLINTQEYETRFMPAELWEVSAEFSQSMPAFEALLFLLKKSPF